MKYYAVKKGHIPGIYTSYEDYCRAIYLAPHHVSKICKNQQIAENFLTTDYQYTKEWESYCQFENMVNGSYKLNSNIDYQGSPEGYQYVCWIDGGSRGGTHYRNNPSGWAFYIVSAHDKHVYKGCGAGFGESNNLMEMMSLYQALVCLIRIGANPDKVLFVNHAMSTLETQHLQNPNIVEVTEM